MEGYRQDSSLVRLWAHGRRHRGGRIGAEAGHPSTPDANRVSRSIARCQSRSAGGACPGRRSLAEAQDPAAPLDRGRTHLDPQGAPLDPLPAFLDPLPAPLDREPVFLDRGDRQPAAPAPPPSTSAAPAGATTARAARPGMAGVVMPANAGPDRSHAAWMLRSAELLVEWFRTCPRCGAAHRQKSRPRANPQPAKEPRGLRTPTRCRAAGPAACGPADAPAGPE